MEALSAYTLPQVFELAERSTYWMGPRWPSHVGFWRDLFLAAWSGEFAALEAAQMQGIPLLAAESLSVSMRSLQLECEAGAGI